ncbi:MAG: hypothetical protein QF662_06010, partial [Phycisphaerae bacterium]|nr:hypothetical protein [Phycisphaerae bacterium]
MAQEANRRDNSQRVLRRAPLILIIMLLLAFLARGLVAYQQASQAAESQDRVTNIYLTVANNILLRNEFASHAGRR